jgi:hypothetical protein
MLNNNIIIEKTLVILIGNARGGEETWETMYENLLKPFDADLALCFGESKNKSASLYRKAKYLWEIPEYQNWRDYYDKNFDTKWDSFMNQHKFKNASLMGGIDKYHGSGAIIFAFRHFILKNKLNVLNMYDRIILTRSDFYYIDKHPFLKLGNLYAVEGEGCGGISDRHFVFDSNMSNDVLGILDFICDIKNFQFLNIYTKDTINPEKALMLFFNFNGIINRLKFCSRVQFTVAIDSDTTRWKKMGNFVNGSSTIRHKYFSEYLNSISNKNNKNLIFSVVDLINITNNIFSHLSLFYRLTYENSKIKILDLKLHRYQKRFFCVIKFLKSILNKLQYFIFKINVIIENKLNIQTKNVKIFQTRNDMLKYYCSKFLDPYLLEIGVFKGDFLKYLINNCKPGTIDAVDLFEGLNCSADVDGNNMVYYDLNKSFLELSEQFKDFSNINIYKSESSCFLEKQMDDKYDIIYIDGDHSYKGVKNDLISAYNKIKDGGFIMGHDYAINLKKTSHIYKFEVKKAVNDFCKEYKQNIIAIALDGYISFAIKIKK